MTDLGALAGDVFAVANDINAKGQVVGASCDANFSCRAWLWDNGVMIDLNSLGPKDTPLYLTWGGGINDRGEIASSAVLKSNPNQAPAFLAIPAPAAQNRRRFGPKDGPARSHPRVASATAAHSPSRRWPDSIAMTLREGRHPCLARLRKAACSSQTMTSRRLHEQVPGQPALFGATSIL